MESSSEPRDNPRDGDERVRALDASGVGLWSWDVARDIVMWDAAMQKLAGGRPTNAAEYVALIEAEDRARVWTAIERALGGAPLEEIEHRFRRPDGEARWVMCKGRVERGADGRPLRLHGACVDVTERRLRHERLVHAHRLESVGRLAGGIAHDFNNMLTVILGTATLAEQKLLEARPDLEEVRGDLAELRRAAERSATLTSQLLAFAGKQAHEPKTFSLDALVRDVERTLRPMLGADVELVLQLGARARVHADPQQIEKVISNLVVNARDAMPSGGTITLRTFDIDHGAGARVRLVVADTGTGIAPEHAARVFEPFFTTKPTGVATGLGLATCYGIIEQNRGTITFDTSVGHGTTFHVDLPVSARPATEPRLPAVQPATDQRGPATILVVEDEDLVRVMSVRSLERYGFLVHAAASGPEALQLLRNTAVDMVVSDIVMPGMSGQELAALVREVWPSMKMLFVSGYSEEQIDGIELLAKPFTPSALAERVKHILARP